jgi:3-oxoacyl-[acyl-carrier protein] reductase
MQLASSRCVVTGATEGIGRAIAFALGARGARVAVCARTPERVETAVGELTDRGVDAIGWPCNVSDEGSVSRFADRVLNVFETADVLVNNAGLSHFAPLTDLTTEQIDEMLTVNIRGVFLVTRAFLPGMLEQRRGQIVNMASLAGRNGVVGGTAYSASKHAVLGFSKSLMLEVRKASVRVIAVCPGSVHTDFFDKAGMSVENPGRLLRPEDVANAVLSALELADGALVSELDIRPANP